MGRIKVKPEIDEKRLGANPLAGIDFKIMVRKILDSEKFKKDGEEWVPVENELEQEAMVKLYVKADNRKIMALLNDAARRLFMWILYELEPSKDYVWLNKRRYMDEVKISSINTYKRGIADLVRLNFIQLTLIKDVYWINPKLFFCGSRINKYPKNVEEYQSKAR